MDSRSDASHASGGACAEPGLHLVDGRAPPTHVQAVREMLFVHGPAIGASAAHHARDLAFVVPIAHWPAAPLLLLRHLHAPHLTFVPVHDDAGALERAARRVRTALPTLRVTPCLAHAPAFVPARALARPGRVVLFLPWCSPESIDGGALADMGRLLGDDGCVLAGVQLRAPTRVGIPDRRGSPPRVPVCWPPDLRPVGAWRDAQERAALVLIEPAHVRGRRRVEEMV